MTAAAEKQKQLVTAHLAAGRFREAHQATRKMLAIWPGLSGAEQLVQEVAEKYPLVVVGVTQPAQTAPFSRRIANPAARQPVTSSFSFPSNSAGRSKTTRLVMFEVTLQPIALIALLKPFSKNA